jgi:hypothetical protein
VRGQAKEQKLTRDTSLPWPPRLDAILYRLYPNNREEAVRQIGRSDIACRLRAFKLHILSVQNDPEVANLYEEEFGISKAQDLGYDDAQEPLQDGTIAEVHGGSVTAQPLYLQQPIAVGSYTTSDQEQQFQQFHYHHGHTLVSPLEMDIHTQMAEDDIVVTNINNEWMEYISSIRARRY